MWEAASPLCSQFFVSIISSSLSLSLPLSLSGLNLIVLHLSLQARAPLCGGHRKTAPGLRLAARRWPALARGRGQEPQLVQPARSARKTCPCGAACPSSACRVGGGGSRSAGSRHLAWPQGQLTPKLDLRTRATLIS